MRLLSFIFILLHYFCIKYSYAYPSAVNTDSSSNLSLSARVDNSLNIHVRLKSNAELDTQSRVTGYGIYFTDDVSSSYENYREWKRVELLDDDEEYDFVLRALDYGIRAETLYRIRATVFINHVESDPSKMIHVHTREAAARAPVIQSMRLLPNTSVLLQFVPADDVPLETNYTVELLEMTTTHVTEDWTSREFLSDSSSRVVIDDLTPNRTYSARLFVSGGAVPGWKSKEFLFFTNASGELPVVVLSPSALSLDPDVSSPLEVKCVAVAEPPPEIVWMVNGQSVHLDHSFYTVASTVEDSQTTSVIRAKSRTRSDELTCIGRNDLGDVTATVRIQIRGPGSPPSTVTLSAERGGYTVSWMPPSHPNGDIKKYVVYHSHDRDEPLSDWQKLDLDGSERRVKVFSTGVDGFYVRVQAASDHGPGIISDIVAIERDTKPISVNLSYPIGSDREENVLEPSERIAAICRAKGKPRPSLQFALSDHANSSHIEDDVWQGLRWRPDGEWVMAHIDVSLVSSRSLHCRAKNSAGFNVSSLHLRVEKPGDAPRSLTVLSIDSRDVVIVWDAPLHPNLPLTSYDLLLIDSSLPDDDPSIYETGSREGNAVSRFSLPSDQLKPSHSYSVRVRARNTAGHGPLSDPVHFITPNGGPEAAPTDVRAEIDESNTVVLSWTTPNCTSNVESYTIFYTRDLGMSNDDYRDWQTIEVPATSTRHKLDYQVGLKPKTFYRVRMSAKNEVAEGPAGKVVEFETANSILPIPTDVSARVDEDNTVHIEFPAVRDPDDHSKAVETYRLELAESDVVVNARWLPVLPSLTHIDDVTNKAELVIEGSRLTSNSMYWLRVTALLDNRSRLVHPSKPIFVRTGRGKLKTRAEIVEGAMLRMEPNDARVFTLTCKAEGSPAPSVEWTWNGESADNETDGWTVREERTERHTVSTLSRDSVRQSGHAVCRAVNDEGEAQAESTLEVLGPGTPPGDVTVNAYRNYLNVSWTHPTVPNGNITKYLVYYSLYEYEDLSDWDLVTVDGEENDVMLTVKEPKTRHLVRVQAVSTSGAGLISTAVDCISDVFYEKLEIKLSADELNDLETEPNMQVTLRCYGKGHPTPRLFYSWQYGEEVELRSSDVEVDEDTFEFSGSFELSTVFSRTVVCRAENKYENKSSELTLVVKKPGDVPTGIVWRFEDDGRLFIDWKPVKYPNGNVSYHIYLSQSDVIVSGPPVLWSKDEIPLNVNLSLRLSAVNEWAEGEKSIPFMVSTPNGGPRDAPYIESLEVNNRSVSIAWTAPTKPMGEIQSYNIFYREDDEEQWQTVEVAGNLTTYILDSTDNVKSDSRYKLRMSARNELNEGPVSDIHSFDTYSTYLQPPYNVTAFLRNSSLFVNVPQISQYQSYVIYIRQQSRQEFWRYEVRAGTGETIAVEDFPLDRNVRYRMKVSGLTNGMESDSSDEFDLVMEEKASTNETNGSDEASKRRLVKEPPLV